MRSKAVTVIGGGLAGLTAAWQLAQRGHRVTVLEREAEVAQGASHANGGLLTPSMSDPWNAPGVYKLLLRSLVDPSAAVAVRPAALPSLVGWGVRFLRNATSARHEAATRAAFALSAYSLRCTRQLREQVRLEYADAAHGSLKIFRSPDAVIGPLRLARMLEREGLEWRQLSAEDAAALEPALAPIASRIAGALFFPGDESGDARRFCVGLAEHLARAGGSVQLGVQATGVEVRQGRAVGVTTATGVLEADAVVVAAGTWSPNLTATAGVELPLRPAKGYSLTVPFPDGTVAPKHAVIDDALHAAVVPLGSHLRVAGTAEFAGFDSTLRDERVRNLWTLLESVYPDVRSRVGVRDGVAWAGFRPMSADGLPVIGESHVRGLWIDAGHGHLGWTMAVGSACLLASMFDGEAPEIPAAPYRAGR